MRVNNAGALSALALLLGSLAPAYGNILFNASFEPSITGDVNAAAIEAAINNAIAFYQTNITTNITVNIAFAEMTSGLGESITYTHTDTYLNYSTDLNSVSSGDGTDNTALGGLPVSSINPVDGSGSIRAAIADWNAIGDSAAVGGVDVCPVNSSGDGSLAGTFNGCVLVNTGITSPPHSLSGNYDLQAVIQHEIDEVLGFGSGLTSGNPPGVVHPQDLFRYASGGSRSFATAACTGAPAAYFSLDGTTDIHPFNNCNNGGDYGDWASTGTSFVQDAFGSVGAAPALSLGSPEAVALDAIGYNFAAPTGTPEPGTMGLFGVSLALLGFISYRRSHRRGPVAPR